MAIFTRKHKDPAQEAYRQMARQKAEKKQYDFIGKTGKMDLDVHETDKYKRAEERFKEVISKPLKEAYGSWYPTNSSSSLAVMNSLEPADVAKKSEYVRERVMENRIKATMENGHYIDEMYLPHAEKHRLAVELFHHEWDKDPKATDFHASKTPIDRVLEEMTRHRPNAENRERIRQAIDTFKGSNDDLHGYLKDKYKFALTEEPVTPYKLYTPEKTILTHEEVMAHKDKYAFMGGRVLAEMIPGEHAWAARKWQLHPDGTKTRVSALLPQTTGMDSDMSGHPFQNEDEQRKNDFHHQNMSDLHGPFLTTNSYYQDAVSQYTKDSGDLNRYLARGALKHGDDEDDAFAHDEHAKALTDAMRDSPPYAHNISVWSGLSRSNDVGKYAARKKDEKEKLVGNFPAFTSTSLNVSEASGFAKDKWAEGFPHQPVRDLARIDIPKAYHRGMYVAPAAEYPDEKEYLLDKDHDMEFHPKPLYYARGAKLYRVWKARPILSDADNETVQNRAKRARES